MDSFKNPQCLKQMTPQMNIDFRGHPSLMTSLSCDFPDHEKSSALRKAQMCLWAHKNVADGIAHFKKGNHEEAFQCLNKGLQIDPENVEAYVAKGALLANLGHYRRAIEDFEMSLKLNPSHSNAREYVCETLVEFGKQLEEKSKLTDAEKCYSRCLELNKDHIVAKEALSSVCRKLEHDIEIVKQNKEEDFLSDLLRIKNELKKKSEEQQYRIMMKEEEDKSRLTPVLDRDKVDVKKEEEKVLEKPEEVALSPLSRKLAMQQNPWAPLPIIIDEAVSKSSSIFQKRCDFPDHEKSSALHCKFALKYVADGIAHFKRGNHEEAFQSLEKALQIDPESVEAFVSKGALLANLGCYEKAIEDFEKSLKCNPSHSTAKKYMCETLVELGKQLEEKSKLKDAEKCYSRCLELNKDHIVAKEALSAVCRKLEPDIEIVKQNKYDFLSDLLQIESELVKKKSEEQQQCRIEAKEEEDKSRLIPVLVGCKVDVEEEEEKVMEKPEEVVLSPLSRKLIMQYNPWAPPPIIIDEAVSKSSSILPVLPPPLPTIPPLQDSIFNMNLFSKPPPIIIDQAVSKSSSILPVLPAPLPTIPPLQDSIFNMNLFNKPPPNWPIVDTSKPPPTAAVEDSGDKAYKARVDQFLKELESREHTNKKRLRSTSKSKERKPEIHHERTRSKHKERKKRRKRRHSSSSSRSSSSSSKSASSTSSASSKNRKTSKKTKKLKRKKSKKVSKKKIKEKKVVKAPTVSMMADFQDLEEKLLAYYEKIKTINTPPEEPASVRKKSKKSASTNKKKSKKKEKQTSKIKLSEHSFDNKLKLSTHPAFLENESVDDAPTKNAKLPYKKAAHITAEKTSKSEIKALKSKLISSGSSISSRSSRLSR